MDGPKCLRFLGAGIIIGLLLLGCSPPEACSYGGVAKAWVDADENGEWDEESS